MFRDYLAKSHANPWTVKDSIIAGSPVAAVMGIVNVTPDSFFDGGKHNTLDAAYEHALKLLDEGAEILDIGGESSRPGAAAVSAEEEIDRVVPLVKKLVPLLSTRKFWISIDTIKSEVALESMKAGAHIINDISALSHDPNMAKTIADTEAASVLNHMRGNFGTMQQDYAPYQDVVADVERELLFAAQKLIDLGVDEKTICLDPGIGFGKDLQNNLDLIAGVETFVQTGFPVLYGMSRKSYIGKISGLEKSDRLIPTVISGIFTALSGATVIRVHDVKEAVESLQLLKAFRK
ncbi:MULTISPECIES: dihydropteroate synthase [Hallerella]|uniref:dihydropteroate synthase n=1 Tax=Hallerella TaxID=2815788 RepID=UPI000D0DFC9D|nr:MULTISPECIES: dihydropteroate synthase [Hallerella]MBS7390633.1 dihydropteroate synthase [Fibrobacter sp.]MCI6872537.1 dihydropteroate synthase [Hallerella sp.]MDD6092921.1 dihydropteroate synthase [Hallerella succinigenes]MDY5028313.1 dihydropteroate synthase [Hallerella succinigenes]